MKKAVRNFGQPFLIALLSRIYNGTPVNPVLISLLFAKNITDMVASKIWGIISELICRILTNIQVLSLWDLLS
jgi:hypothetical protein